MCSPSIALLSVAVAAQTYGAYQQQKAANQANAYNAMIMGRNAEVANQQATQAERQGKLREQVAREQTSQRVGAQRAAFSTSGVLVDSGSTADTVAQTENFGELDAMTIRRNTQLEAWGHRAQSSQAVAQANLLRSRRRSPFETAGFTLLTSGASAGGQYYAAKGR